jgi:hypothetical protein
MWVCQVGVAMTLGPMNYTADCSDLARRVENNCEGHHLWQRTIALLLNSLWLVQPLFRVTACNLHSAVQGAKSKSDN